MWRHLTVAASVAVATCACRERPTEAQPAPAPPRARATPSPTPSGPLIVVLGDSLAAGEGLAEELAFPAVLARELAAAGDPVRIVNAGVGGDTTAGGLRRLDWLLRQEPDIVVVELGANDGLRGLDLADTERNLRAILSAVEAAGARAVLCGMLLPANYGPEYIREFGTMFPRLAEELDVPLVPFLLEGVGGVSEMNLADGIHPNAAGHEQIARTLLPYIESLLGADGGG